MQPRAIFFRIPVADGPSKIGLKDALGGRPNAETASHATQPLVGVLTGAGAAQETLRKIPETNQKDRPAHPIEKSLLVLGSRNQAF